MTFITIAGVVLCGWTFLSVLGGERRRRVRQLNAEPPPPAPDDAAANARR